MKYNKVEYTVINTELHPEDEFTETVVDLMKKRYNEINRHIGHCVMSGTSLHDTSKRIRKLINTHIRNVVSSGKHTINVAIVYHRDLDGGTSAMLTASMIRSMIVECLDFYKSNTVDVFIGFQSINYQDRISNNTKSFLSNADVIFCVDYSFSNHDHVDLVFGNEDAVIVYIDHHETSYKYITDNDSKLKTAISNPKVEYLIVEYEDVSASMLCYMLYTSYNIMLGVACEYIESKDADDEGAIICRSIPEYVMMVSLYDTFSKYAKREFMLGVNTFPHMPFDYKDIEDGYYYNYCGNSYNLRAAVGLFETVCLDDRAFNRSLFTINKIPLFGVHDLPRIEQIYDTGNIILQYDKKINKMACMRCMFEVDLLFGYNEDGTPHVYNVAVVNRSGNSFIFEEEYSKHDGVILFAQNKHLTFTYSFFTDKHTDNPNKMPCSAIGEHFGGGGHTTAAGCTIDTNLFDPANGYIVRYEDDSTRYKLDLNK